MKVIRWISYDDEAEKMEDSKIGGLGGFFGNGMRWKDYIDQFTDKGKVYVEALRSSIVGHQIKRGGDAHQSEQEALVPVFEDETVAMFSYRGWGDLLAAIWSEEENKDYNYMDFYMDDYTGRGAKSQEPTGNMDNDNS